MPRKIYQDSEEYHGQVGSLIKIIMSKVSDVVFLTSPSYNNSTFHPKAPDDWLIAKNHMTSSSPPTKPLVLFLIVFSSIHLSFSPSFSLKLLSVYKSSRATLESNLALLSILVRSAKSPYLYSLKQGHREGRQLRILK